MNNLITVMKFTMKDMMRKKSFIISTIIILVLIVAAFSIPKIIKLVSEGSSNQKIILVDKDNIFEGNINQIAQMQLENYEFSFENLSEEEIKNKVKEEDFDSAIIVEKNENAINLRYIVRDSRWTFEVPEDIMRAINTMYIGLQINKLGLTDEQLEMLNPKFEFNIENADDDKNLNEGNIAIMMGMSLALSMAVILCAAQVSTSITTEKTSKIIETLVTSTSPKTIVLGKTIGIGLVGLFQILLAIVTAFISAKVFLDEEMIRTFLDVSNITVGLGAITILYFILGYFTYSLLYALTGSMVSKIENIQSSNTPVSLLCMVGFYLGYFSISMAPTSNVATFAGIFPLSSPFCMPSRIMMGLASTGEIIASVVLLIAMVLAIAKVAIKIYSSAILNYGSKLSFKDVLKTMKTVKRDGGF